MNAESAIRTQEKDVLNDMNVRQPYNKKGSKIIDQALGYMNRQLHMFFVHEQHASALKQTEPNGLSKTYDYFSLPKNERNSQ